MINVDFLQETIHTFKFDADQIKEILIEALRITGNDIPDCPDVEVDEQPDFDVKLTFTQEDLDDYLKDKAEAMEPEPEEETHWVTGEDEETVDFPAEAK
jgi:hypothetical protein